LSMPHSPRLHNDEVFLLDSGSGSLKHVDRQTGGTSTITQLPGFTRGLSFWGPYAFVGLSRIRETSVFGGIPIAAERERLRCGIMIVDLRTGQLVGHFYFQSGVTEIFAVEVLPTARCPYIVGPECGSDEGPPIWYAPGPVPAESREVSQEEIDSLVLLGDEHQRQQQWASAAAYYQEVLRVLPNHAAVAARLGDVLHHQGRYAEAEAAYKTSLDGDPGHAEVLMAYGNLLRELNRLDEARYKYEQALASEPGNAVVHANLAQTLSDLGFVNEAETHFVASNRIHPIPKAKIAAATMLPPIYQSMVDLEERRRRLFENIQALQVEGVRMDPTREVVPHLFYPAYQGLNDAGLYREYAQLFSSKEAEEATATRKREGRIRLGILSEFFTDHTIGHLNRGLVEQLDRQDFHVTVLSAGVHDDPIARSFQEHADTYLVIPPHVPIARRQILDLRLDALIYTDLGMSAFTYSLAFSRLAPLQAVLWGHPQTTGIPAIDFFLSGEDLDPFDGQHAYTEQLVRLAGLQTYYYRPQRVRPRRTRDDFALPASGNLYGCPQSLFKFHPEFDELLAEILRGDPQGQLVLLEGKHPQWTNLLRQRWSGVMPDVMERIHFLPRISRPDFLHLLAECDVLLDPLHFGGGNTSFEAMSVGTPVVTMPSRYLRGRITLAQYAMMGLHDCVVGTKADYVTTAIRLGTDTDFRHDVSGAISETCPILFEHAESIRAIEDFLKSAFESVCSTTTRELHHPDSKMNHS
ncbi:MAG: DUF4915 domain-containing protein, partial [Pirellulales bacterium]|nr:DUF4915 domain-containing protein [Pirellulales bacterium]